MLGVARTAQFKEVEACRQCRSEQAEMGRGGGADALEDVTLGALHRQSSCDRTLRSQSSLLGREWGQTAGPGPAGHDPRHGGGQAVVQPAVTASYGLSAKAGPTRKFLGHVTVSVDTSTCDEVELPNLVAHLREQIVIAIAAEVTPIGHPE